MSKMEVCKNCKTEIEFNGCEEISCPFCYSTNSKTDINDIVVEGVESTRFTPIPEPKKNIKHYKDRFDLDLSLTQPNRPNRLLNKIFSEQTYYNLQTIPFIIIVFIFPIFLFQHNILIIVALFIAYFLYVIILKYARMVYEQKFKNFRFLDLTLYSDTFAKVQKGWMVSSASIRKETERLLKKEKRENLQTHKIRREKLIIWARELLYTAIEMGWDGKTKKQLSHYLTFTNINVDTYMRDYIIQEAYYLSKQDIIYND